MKAIVAASMRRPRLVLWAGGLFSAVLIALVAAPTLAPGAFAFLQPLKIDTDPENMLAESEPVRVYHNAMKAEFGLHDLIVVGVVAPDNAPEGAPEDVFTPEILGEVHALAEFAKTLRWRDGEETRGVIAVDIIAPSTVDSIDQAGLGAVSFSWLMPAPPQTAEDARAVRARAQKIPTLNGTLVSDDGRAIALYIPITSKDVSYRVASALRAKIAELAAGAGAERATYHITGLPVAQDQFGVEMFRQMAISAPAAMALIFFLMWAFFRNLNLIVSPMIVAMVSVVGAMGALIVTGQTVHIMSSMIPIFVMPIAVLDGVHILSDFYDRYPQFRDRRETLRCVMDELWRPMLFTTVTTCAGFGSLALTPIPPVQVFGVFVALGVFLAWLFTVTLIPAYVMLMPERAFAGFGLAAAGDREPHETAFSTLLRGVGAMATSAAKPALGVFLIAAAVAVYGVSRIEINDNPVKWFSPEHDIRVADRALNERFAGTYMAYLTLTPPQGALETTPEEAAQRLVERLCGDAPCARTLGGRVADAFDAMRADTVRAAQTGDAFIAALAEKIAAAQAAAVDDDAWAAWDAAAAALGGLAQEREIFKRPDVLRYVADLQEHLRTSGLVGKSNALPDIVKTVHRELLLGAEEEFRIPDTSAAVAQTLLSFENSHRPQDLYKLVTPDFTKANLWLQLKSGDNKDMNALAEAVAAYMADNPAPTALEHDWFGLTYINTVWQDRMVWGMARSFAGSFLAVLVLMTLLFRSFAWGLLSMAPLTVTILMIYGLIGLIGKDYDMPIAVLSSLSLGLAVDYAIHFNARAREAFARLGDWKQTARAVFGEPARAIARNVIVIGAGFMPLLLAPLVPYQTVGAFISAILVLAGLSTLIALPAVITLFEGAFFRPANSSAANSSTANSSAAAASPGARGEADPSERSAS